MISLFLEQIYQPLLAILQRDDDQLQNSMDGLIKAIETGKIVFYRGRFTGNLTSSLSRDLKKLGAKWDRRQGCFTIPLASLDPDMRRAISLAEARFKQTFSRVQSYLSTIAPEEVADKFKAEKLFDRTIFKVEKSFQESVKGITIAPELTDDQRARIAEEYSKNMQLYIKDFAEKEIEELRKRIQENSFKGIRYESVIKEIQRSYGVSVNKARFLARQETSLLMTKYKQVRYQAAGVNEYVWRCVAGSPAHPVRPWHKKHDGKVFRWDKPPQTDAKGNRKNPGQDYNCRCVARPIVRF